MSGYPIEWRAALGRDQATINKFGHQESVGTTLIPIWDQALPYSYLAAAVALNVTSDDVADTSAGTGAQTVKVYGLDANYVEVDETVTLNGQTIVVTTQTFLRVFRVIVLTAGSGGTNAGPLYVFTGTESSGVPTDLTKVYAKVMAGEAQTLMAIYTVPADRKALVAALFVAGDSSKTVTVKLVARPLGGVFNTKDKFLVKAGNTLITHVLPVVFDEKTDIEVRGKVSTGSTEISAAFDAVLVDKIGGDA